LLHETRCKRMAQIVEPHIIQVRFLAGFVERRLQRP